MNKANALMMLGNHAEAIEVYDQTIAIRRRLVDQGQREVVGDLAKAQLHRAVALGKCGRHAEAIRAAREAIPVLEAEVRRNDRSDLRALLESARKAFQAVL